MAWIISHLLLFLNIVVANVLLAQNINSFQNSNVGISCIDGVCFSNTGKGFYYGNNNADNCNVIMADYRVKVDQWRINLHESIFRNNKIYKNGQYLRDMNANDFAKMADYRVKVDQWRINLHESIFRNFPWSDTNPERVNFPWNPFGAGSPYAGLQQAINQNAAKRVAAALAAVRGPRQVRQRRAYLPFPQVPNLCAS
ncbi:unnamed protein product [Gongylonema pulchrum]|uniref:Pepsin-I3 domain-containing protein n=1 Tax=Gongylonema pulchrum TaxID=637853 RepID=A0A183ED38_9BILA|nr:unnamed protein product [Gongylonema pulchrum]